MYNIPEDATLLKEGLYIQYYTFPSGLETIRLFAAEGWAIYYKNSVEGEDRTYHYKVYLAINDSVDNYDVVQVTPGMEVVGKPEEIEVI